jgi:hypothetical protein
MILTNNWNRLDNWFENKYVIIVIYIDLVYIYQNHVLSINNNLTIYNNTINSR